jgi:NAD dependent epimerase/dehydratase family enzyme
MPYIHVDDLTTAIRHIIDNQEHGVYNLVGPNPVDHAGFVKAIASVKRVLITPRIPGIFLAPVLGKARVLLTSGPMVLPERLKREGFVFNYRDLDQALKNLYQTS